MRTLLLMLFICGNIQAQSTWFQIDSLAYKINNWTEYKETKIDAKIEDNIITIYSNKLQTYRILVRYIALVNGYIAIDQDYDYCEIYLFKDELLIKFQDVSWKYHFINYGII